MNGPLISGNNHSKFEKASGTEARIIASTSTMMMPMISRTKRVPTECGR
jgi:hypothetical protein